MTTEPVIVIGAGIVGTATARALQRSGHAVTLVDSAEPGKATSYGNAGFIAIDHVLPLARPSIGTVVVLNFMWVWNDFIYPLVYVDSADRYTIPLGILQYQSRLGVQWGTQMAALSVAAGVPLIVYIIFQRQFIRGVLAGSLKG